ncbi:RhoGAP-domain-containing protein [Hypoxylon trugodes]|uniref:RhoGAP-domain-containing protein n=1 Tax=Hypoxylon trugodes TaxID=326681 RepID=UPI0021A219F3|nr:RhoGAP-domain-containing protein [Hypoxylon trugodes]KAI1383142.1 RhoGAP-domain-containing protein [Hypoxylon trugodes]
MMEEYTDSPLESDDVFPCKGCGEILEEGKAFELAGNRWHLNCFRCNTCGTLLDSDANLLLLGDGSLICNNCTYSCSACGDKIEDLAILTGDQAFCAACFRCRNCKRKIENLRYARTSQGIFCMNCHESLMARRRKKSKAAAQAKAREKDASPMIMEKSLPALPPNAIPPNAFSNDRVDPESDTPTELSPRPRPAYPRNDSSRSSSRPDRSPDRSGDHSGRDNGLPLPSQSYRNNRNSSIFSGGDITGNNGGDDQSFFIPVALDPSPVPSVTPRSTSEALTDSNKKTKEKDYFSLSKPTAGPERRDTSQSSTPHIAFQEKGRQPSFDHENPPPRDLGRKLSKSSKGDKSATTKSSPTSADDRSSRLANGRSHPSDDFKLQEAPKSKKLNTRTGSQSNAVPDSTVSRGSSNSSRKDKDGFSSDSPQHLHAGDKTSTPRSSQESRLKDDDEVRSNDSMATSVSNNITPITRKELPASALRNVNGSASRPTANEQKTNDQYMTPRAPPAPPTSAAGQESANATGETKASPKLPRWSAGGDFSMDEDMARILGTDEGSSSILRRVSNAVRHGRTNSTESSNNLPRVGHTRSASETTRSTTTSPRWPKTPIAEDAVNGTGHDISSPLSINSNDDPVLLRRRLRNSEQRVAELERQFNNEKDLKNLTQKLEEKRKTVSVLDTQTEIMIRQLEALAGYVERAKETKRPIDPRELEDSALKDFVQRLEKLKQSMSASLEQLHAERDELLEEKNKAIAERDRARVEFEQLVSKNAQLADLNNDLTNQIQERFKNHSDPKSPPNGLGIYNSHKGASNNSISLDSSSIQTGTTVIAVDQEEPILEAGPTVVKIGKGQVKKFNWKKGSKAMAQNIAKGVNRTVVAFQQPERERHQPGMAGESIGLPYNMTVVPVESPVSHTPVNGQNRQPGDASRQGFFGFKKANTMPKGMAMSNMSIPAIAEAPSVLFGSELADRADYERRQIPCVVTRCIEEVELRGMDMEGIYRKTGGNSQTKAIQEGFDKNENFDISDPDIDITAVTSVLKQYFRKLPTPLLTFDVYDRILETNSIQTDEEKCTHLQSVFKQLPSQHKDCLEFLMFHLHRVASRERENLMTPKNLAVVFAPTIMRDHNIEREMTDMHAKNLAVQFIIENTHNIFI